MAGEACLNLPLYVTKSNRGCGGRCGGKKPTIFCGCVIEIVVAVQIFLLGKILHWLYIKF